MTTSAAQPYKQRPETRDAILDAAGRLVRRLGYSKLTMVDLAREAGLGKATVYRYFRDKIEVVAAYWERVQDGALLELTALRDADNRDVTERLTRFLVKRVMLGYDGVEPYLFQITDILTTVRAPFLKQRRNNALQEARIMEPLLVEGESRGALVFSDALETALTLITATNSLLPLGLSQGELEDRDMLEQRAHRLASILVRGILTAQALGEQVRDQ